MIILITIFVFLLLLVLGGLIYLHYEVKNYYPSVYMLLHEDDTKGNMYVPLTEQEEINIFETLGQSYALNDSEFLNIVKTWNERSALHCTMVRIKSLLGVKDSKLFAQILIAHLQRLHDVKYGIKDLDDKVKPMEHINPPVL